MKSPPRFAPKLSHVYNIAPGRPAYWANASSVADASLYQRAFLDAFEEHHDSNICTEKENPNECIRRMHAPICEVRECFKSGMFVVRGRKSQSALTLQASAMPWIDVVIFVANQEDIAGEIGMVQDNRSMDVFQIPVSEKAPFGHCNSLLQNVSHNRTIRADSVNDIKPKTNSPLYLKSLIDGLKGSVCIACKAGSNRSTSSLIAYALLSSSKCNLDNLLAYFARIRRYRNFDYNISQLITIAELARHHRLQTHHPDGNQLELLPQDQDGDD